MNEYINHELKRECRPYPHSYIALSYFFMIILLFKPLLLAINGLVQDYKINLRHF